MYNYEIVSVEVFCEAYKLSKDIVVKWQQMGLIEILNEDNKSYLSNEELGKIEQLIRIQTELQILPDDIDVVYNLIERVKILQSENDKLKRILNHFYT